jgi:hypothetical protein
MKPSQATSRIKWLNGEKMNVSKTEMFLDTLFFRH